MMKTVVADIAQVPEVLRGEYEQRDGAFHLKLEGAAGFVPAAELASINERLGEFRNNNIALLKEKVTLEEKLKNFANIDPAEYVALKTKVTELEKKGVTGATDLSALTQRAVDAAVGPIQARLDDMARKEALAETRAAEAERRAERKALEGELVQMGIKLGVASEAMPDYVRRGLETFVMEGGQPIAKRGDVPIYSRIRGSQPLSVEEWATDLAQDAPHLFKPNKGGGAAGGTGAGAGGGPKRVIAASDMGKPGNLEDVAAGKAVVAQ